MTHRWLKRRRVLQVLKSGVFLFVFVDLRHVCGPWIEDHTVNRNVACRHECPLSR